MQELEMQKHSQKEWQIERIGKNGKNGNGGQYKDKDPKDLPVIKGEKDKEQEVKSAFIPRANKRR